MPKISDKLRECAAVLEASVTEANETLAYGEEADAMDQLSRRVSMVCVALLTEARAIECIALLSEASKQP